MVSTAIENVFGVVAVVSSGYRPEDLNSLIGGHPNSQHQYIEGFDLVFFKDGYCVTDRGLMIKIYAFILKNFGHRIRQLLLYKRKLPFIHCGFATNRYSYRLIRTKNKI